MKKKTIAQHALTAWVSSSATMTLLWAIGSNASWYFVAFYFFFWPVWLFAAKTGNLWLVDWLPLAFWTAR